MGSERSINELFLQAIALLGSERDRFLSLLASEAREEVEALLDADARAENSTSFLQPIEFTSAPAEWKVGDLIEGTYRVRSVVTTGAMSVVYFVWHERWDTELAVKFPRPSVFSSWMSADDGDAEAKTWIGLGTHPNIVTAYFVKRFGKYRAIVMDKLNGGSVKDALAAGRMDSLPSKLDVAIQVARGLAFATSNYPDFIHRDVKPANILLTGSGVAKLTDFGLANLRDAVTGTPAYMAPEVWVSSKMVGPPADVYSLGVVLYEMLTGRRPFGKSLGTRFTSIPKSVITASLRISVDDSSASRSAYSTQLSGSPDDVEIDTPDQRDPLMALMLAHMRETPRQPCDIDNDIPDELSEFCLRMLDKDLKKRPSAAEVVVHLTSFYEATTETEYPGLDLTLLELPAATFNNLAVTLLDFGREAEADRLWDEAARIDPRDAISVFNRGLFAWRKGKLTDSALLECLDNVAAGCGDNSSVAYLKALIHLESGDCAAAAARLEGVGDSIIAGMDDVEDIRQKAHIGSHNESNQIVEIDAHDGAVTAVRFNKNGTGVITSGSDGKVKLFDARLEKTVTFVGEHQAPVMDVELTADWMNAVSIDTQGVIKFWSITDRRCVKSVETGIRESGSIKMACDGHTCLIVGCFKNTAENPALWDVLTGRRLGQLSRPETGHPRFVSTEKDLAITADSTALRSWQLSTGELQGEDSLEPCMTTWHPIAFDENGQEFVTTDEDGNITLFTRWTDRTKYLNWQFTGHDERVFDLAAPAALSRFASVGMSGKLRLWNVRPGRCLRTLETLTGSTAKIDISATGQRIAVGTRAGKLFILDWPDVGFTAPYLLSQPIAPERQLENLREIRLAVSKAEREILEARFSCSAKTIGRARGMAGCRCHPDLIAMWSRLYERLPKRSLQAVWEKRSCDCHRSPIHSLRISTSGNCFISVLNDQLLHVHDLDTGKIRWTFVDPEFVQGQGKGDTYEFWPECRTWCADLSSDGQLIAVGASDQSIHLWNTLSGERVLAISASESPATVIRFTAAADRLVAGNQDGDVCLYELATGTLIHDLCGHSDAVTAMCVSSDDRVLVTASDDQTIRIWDLNSGECLEAFGDCDSGALVTEGDYVTAASREPYLSIRTHPKGPSSNRNWPVRREARPVFSICTDQSRSTLLRSIGSRLEVWVMDPPTLVRSIDAHDGVILDVDISDDGQFAVSTGSDRRIRFWDLASAECKQSIRRPSPAWSVQLSQNAETLISGELGNATQWILDWDLGDSGFSTSKLEAQPLDQAQLQDISVAMVIDRFIASADDVSHQAHRVLEYTIREIRSVQPLLVNRMSSLVERLLSTRDDTVGAAAAHLLWGAGDAAVEPLRAGIRSLEEPFRRRVVSALGSIGAPAKSAIPDLLVLLGDRDRAVAQAASDALFCIGAESIPHLCQTVRAKERETRNLALTTLHKFGSMAQSEITMIDRDLSVISERERARESSVRLLVICLCVAVPLIGLVWGGILLSAQMAETTSAVQNKATSQHRLRQASELIDMWTTEVSPNFAPYAKPSFAVQVLHELANSSVDNSTREQARGRLQTVEKHKHYFDFVENLNLFVPLVAEIEPLLSHMSPVDMEPTGPLEFSQPLMADFIVVTLPYNNPKGIGDQPDGMTIDAEVISAIGSKCAEVPEELGTIVVLQWYTTPHGTEGFGVERLDRKLLLTPPHIACGCIITAVSFPSRHVIQSRRIEAYLQDYEAIYRIMEAPQFSAPYRQKDRLERLRGVVRQTVIQKLKEL